jgi:hypothetical protein
MPVVFERRRQATPAETAALIASFDAAGLELEEAEVSELATLADLGRAHTVLRLDVPAPGRDFFSTIAEVAPVWAAGGGTGHDQDAYRRGVERVANPAYEPELLFAPTPHTSSGWWMIDANHRAAAYYNTRAAAGVTAINLRVFVMPRPVS